MKKPASRSALIVAFVVVVLAVFAWHFNRKMEQIKQQAKPRAVRDKTYVPVTDRTAPESEDPGASALGETTLPILACFCSDWNYRCQGINEIMSTIEGMFGQRLQVRLIDPSVEAQLAKRFKIKELPTFILFDARGRLVLREEAAMSEEELVRLLRGVVHSEDSGSSQ